MNSDNFVKRNLKRKYHGKNEARSNKLKRWKFKERRERNESKTGEKINKPLGLGTWGIDALNLSLKRFARSQVESKSAQDKPLKELSLTKLGYSDEEIQLFHQHAPKCTGHQMSSKLFLVKKSGPNKGRYFYTCTFPSDQRCSFFLWVEDNPDLLTVLPRCQNSSDYAVKCYQKKLLCMTKDQLFQEIHKFNARLLTKASFDCDEMTIYRQIFPKKREIGSRLQTSGKSKEDLIQSLLTEVKKLLGFHAEILTNLKPHLNPFKFQNIEQESKDSSAGNAIGMSEEMILLSDSESDDDSDNYDDEEEDEEGEANNNHQHSNQASNISANSVQLINDRFSLEKMVSSWYFGYSEFREGQGWAIRRCLTGQRSLLVMPTGYGKSLCYILPSLILPGITLVISPLIALMQDQIMKLPPELPAVCLNSHLSTKDSAEACLAILNHQVKIIFISPEKFCSSSFRSLIRQLHSRYGRDHISLLCVDEAHCLSHWSYHFRPAFLRISREIKMVSPRAVLALTATASHRVAEDIIQHLQLGQGESASSSRPYYLRIDEARQNLQLTARFCSSEEEKKQVLLSSLSSSSSSSSSVQKPLTIVYVWRRKDAEILGEYLKAVGIDTVVYHGGMDQTRRSSIQKQFDRGNARCIIATVAFGMGIDKQDIRQVIHYSLPKSLENYLQEIGRAGRDGQTSACSLLFSTEETLLQYNYAFNAQVSRLQIFTLFLQIFPFQESLSSQLSLAINQIAQQLDLSETLLETILSILELPPLQFLRLERNHYDCIEGRFRFLQDRFEKLMASKETMELSLQQQGEETERDQAKSLRYQILQRKLLQTIHSHNELSSGRSTQKKLPKFLSSEMSDDEEEEEPLQNNDEADEAVLQNYSFFESSASIDRQAASSSSFLQPFRISKTLLANELQLSLDEVCDLLYQLQKNGLVEYRLKEPHFLLHLQSASIPHHERVEDYLRWIHLTVDQVSTQLDQIQSRAGAAVLKMFKIAEITAKHCPVVSSREEIVASKSDALHEFVLKILNDEESVNEASLNPQTTQFALEYKTATSPFKNIESQKVKAEISAEYRMMQSNTIFLQYYQYLLEECLSKVDCREKGSAVTSSLHQIFQSERKSFLIVYMMKLFYGFSSNFMAMNGLKGDFSIFHDLWNKYKLYDFQEIHQYLSGQ